MHWIRLSRKTARFGFVDRVHVPRIARTRATYRCFRLELRNTVLKSYKLQMQFRRSKKIVEIAFVVLELLRGNKQCFGIYVGCSVPAAKVHTLRYA